MKKRVLRLTKKIYPIFLVLKNLNFVLRLFPLSVAPFWIGLHFGAKFYFRSACKKLQANEVRPGDIGRIQTQKGEEIHAYIYISKNFVSITKYDLKNWNEVTLELRNFIKNYLEINEINFKRKEVETEEIDLDDTSKKIISILDEYIKPAVSSDGGNILFDSYDKDKKLVKVILQGACSGCPSSTVTLKNGIENMLKEMLSDKVNSVEAING